jgi:hypothetical protein
MATDIELRRSGAYEPIDYSRFSVEITTSAIAPTPSASVTTQANEPIDVNQDCRIVIDGTTVFEGQTESAGSINRNGQVSLSVVHPHDALFEERISLSLSGTVTAIDVLEAALNNSNRGDSTMLSWSGNDVTLDSGYDVENRQLTAIFRDMTDRTGRVWWVDPSGTTINVEPKGDRGTWNSIDTQADKAVVETYDDGSVATVRNDVTVIATGEEAVSATATDATSISEYGRRSEEINIGYAATAGEAQAYADELIIPDPLASATVLVTEQIGDVTQPLANFTIDLTDDGKNIDTSGLVIEKQTLEQGRVTLEVGEGSGVSIENVNRGSKSQDDTTEPGSVYGGDRIGDDSITESKLQDLSVSVDKIQDQAVAEAKVRTEAISEVKVQDDSISTPKLQVGSVTAGKIDVAAVTATAIAADAVEAGKIDADAVGARELIANSITADEIDTLNLDTGELTIGANADSFFEFTTELDSASGQTFAKMNPSDPVAGKIGDINPLISVFASTVTANSLLELGTDTADIVPNNDNVSNVGQSFNAFSEMHAYAFIDADTGSELSDGGDPLSGLAEGHGPPDHCQPLDDDGNVVGTDISSLSKWLADICRAQQSRIDDLEERLSSLEEQI